MIVGYFFGNCQRLAFHQFGEQVLGFLTAAEAEFGRVYVAQPYLPAVGQDQGVAVGNGKKLSFLNGDWRAGFFEEIGVDQERGDEEEKPQERDQRSDLFLVSGRHAFSIMTNRGFSRQGEDKGC